MLKLIDCHCHLSFKDYPVEEIPLLLHRAKEAGISHLVTIGAGEGWEGNPEALKIANSHPHIFCTLGIHPHDAALVTPDTLQKIKVMATDPKVVAIGEIGLDYHYENSPRDIQREVLKQFIDLALEIKKPIMIHDRDAGDETYQILQERGASQVMIHCFTGTPELAQKYLEAGYFLSFTGILTFKNSETLRDIVRKTPLTQILTETDSPFLTPVPHRGKKNEPAFVRHVVEKIAEIKNLSLETVAEQVFKNAGQFFGEKNFL